MKQELQSNAYLLLDSRNAPLARGLLESPPESATWQVRVLDDKISAVMEHEEIQMVSMASSGAALLGRILRSRNDFVVLEKLQKLDSDMRQNLRMPAHFRSFLYPVTGSWRGRREIRANDLSCGGLAFFCSGSLAERERVEVVIPITTEPVILRLEILRQRPTDQEDTVFYAGKFVDMCNDEEMLVREAVFNIQLQSRPRPSGAD